MIALWLCQCGCGEAAPLATQNHAKRGYVKGQPMAFVRGHQHIGRPSPLKIQTKPNTTVYCACGCGELTPVAIKTNTAQGYQKGRPHRFIQAHVGRMQGTGEAAANWRGGRIVTEKGYILIHRPGHPRASSLGYVLEHLLIAEKALGRPIPRKHPVHHANEMRSDNRNGNLVICESRAYHRLLHHRLWAWRQTGSVTGSVRIEPMVKAHGKETSYAL